MIEAIVDPTNILAVIVALACFATIVTLAAPMMKGDRLDTRLRAGATRRDERGRRSRAQLNAARTQGGNVSSLRHADSGLVKNFVDRMNLKKLLEDPLVVDKLAQAGYRGPRPVTVFYFFRF